MTAASAFPTHTADGREIVLWSCREDAEHLRETSVREAVEEWVAGLFGEVPECVYVNGYARSVVGVADTDRFLDVLLDALDEEYGDPDGENTQRMPAMREATEAWVAAVIKEYTPWSCDCVVTLAVNVKEVLGE